MAHDVRSNRLKCEGQIGSRVIDEFQGDTHNGFIGDTSANRWFSPRY